MLYVIHSVNGYCKLIKQRTDYAAYKLKNKTENKLKVY